MNMKVTEQALKKRIQRKLKHTGDILVKVRENSRWFNQYGPYMVTDSKRMIQAHGCEIEDLGREVGALRAGEELTI